MKKILMRMLGWVPVQGETVKPMSFRTVYPEGTPMSVRPHFNNWIEQVRKALS